MNDQVVSEALRQIQRQYYNVNRGLSFYASFYGHNWGPSSSYAYNVYNPYDVLRYNPNINQQMSTPSDNFQDAVNGSSISDTKVVKLFDHQLHTFRQQYHETQSHFGNNWNEASNDVVGINYINSQPAVKSASFGNFKRYAESNHPNVYSENNGLINDMRSEPVVDNSRRLSENTHPNVRNDVLTNDFKSEPAEKFICDPCGKTFKQFTYLQQHFKSLSHIRQNSSDSKAEVRCETCGISFKKHAYLTQHISERHNGLNFPKCVKCGKVFGTEEECNKHFARHFPEQRYNRVLHSNDLYYCLYCDRACLSLTSLEIHQIRFHLEGRSQHRSIGDT